MKNIFASFLSIMLLMMAAVITSPACSGMQDSRSMSISGSSWRITADRDSREITVSHDSLGTVLTGISLNTITGGTISPLKEWSTVEQEGEKLIVQTGHPFTVWTFEAVNNDLVVSATRADLCITGKAPATAERVVARLLDTSGVPVDWCGTNEITNSWNGKDTHNPSFLPQVNPEVMTFALGQVAAGNLHSLFDRRSDMAIDFPSSASMLRDPEDPDILDMTIPVPGRTIIRIIPDYFTGTLGVPFYKRFDDSAFPSAPVIWGSWTAYYYQARESDLVSNTDWLAANLLPYGFQYVQLDDGYDRGKEDGHYWIENWNKALFPHGPGWLAGYIKSKGLRPGLWLVPNSYAGFFRQHPEYYLYDKSGKVIMDYKTPALDHTNPAVREWLKKLFGTLRNWGFEYFKFDGEMSLPAYVPDIDTGRLFDSRINPIVAYRNRLGLIREAIGPDAFIEGCVAGAPLDGIGYFNSCFNGADMYNSWKGSYAVFSSINANAFLNHMLLYVMPGEGIDVSPPMSPEEARQKMAPRSVEVALTREDPFTGFGTTLAEARTLVTIVSLTGVSYPLTSIMPQLPEERVRLLKMTMPTMPVLPVDLYSRGSDITWDKFKFTTTDTYIHDYPEIIDLKVNAPSGVYDVAAFTNWRGEPTVRQISLSGKLGLAPGNQYIAFDFWNQKLLGVFGDRIDVDIESHDTRVILLHNLQEHPQLIGLSRHISGAFSVGGTAWDNSSLTLSGSSELIAGDPYTLFIYVPDSYSLLKAGISSGENADADITAEMEGSQLKVTIVSGRSGHIDWQLLFRAASAGK